MKKRAFALTLALCGLFTATVPAIAADSENMSLVEAETQVSTETQTEFVDALSTAEASVIVPGHPRVVVNDKVLELQTPATIVDGVTYVPYLPIIKALFPDTFVQSDGEVVQLLSVWCNFEIPASRKYVVVNGRYLYQPEGMTEINGELMFSARTLCNWLGADVSWDSANYCVVITANGQTISSGDSFYNSNDLYWLSHIINAESGNQSLEGKIAVGNVVLNRVASSQFPNTIKEVIYQKNQFTPVKNGSINLEPNAESVIAAKLCLDGANTAGNALFFLNPRTAKSSWASKNRPYLMTIGAHAFYG